MADKILSLKLHYKGKLLDIAKYGRDFTKKLYIGSSKYLFWQILDNRFPIRHLFLINKAGKFYFNLLSNMKVSFQQNGQELDIDSLKAKQILNGNEVYLAADMTGSVQIDHDWVISYEYREPYVTVYNEEERQIISQYARRAELQPSQKFTRNFLLIALAVTILGLIVFDAVKPDYNKEDTLEERWKQMQAVATKVEIPPVIAEQPGSEPSAPSGKVTEKPVPGGATYNAPSGTMSKSDSRAALESLFGPGAGNGKGFVAVTTEEDIVAFNLSGKGGGGGGGSGKGPGSNGSGGGSGYGNPGSGNGSGYGNLFNPSDIPSGTQDLAGLSNGKPLGKLSNLPPSGDVTTFVGNAQRIAPLGKPTSKLSSSVVTRFSGPTVKKVAESGINSAPADTRPELQRIEQKVARFKPQIKDLYNRYSQIKSMYGTIRFLMYIDNDGSVAAVQITPVSGEFYPEFLSQLEKLIRSWRFDNKNLVPYEFIMTFTK